MQYPAIYFCHNFTFTGVLSLRAGNPDPHSLSTITFHWHQIERLVMVSRKKTSFIHSPAEPLFFFVTTPLYLYVTLRIYSFQHIAAWCITSPYKYWDTFIILIFSKSGCKYLKNELLSYQDIKYHPFPMPQISLQEAAIYFKILNKNEIVRIP